MSERPVGADGPPPPPRREEPPADPGVSFLGRTLGLHADVRLPEVEGTPAPHSSPAGPGGLTGLAADLGRYRILGEIGRGGVGAVYRARDIDLGRDVALKVLLESHRGHPEATKRFIEEAQISGQLQHPGIVPLHEIGLIAGDIPYFTMKLVKGTTLEALLVARKDPASSRQRFLGVFQQVAETMAYAHARGVIHRDLKPSNVLVGAFGEVQVIDWGLAKVISEGGIADERRARKSHVELSVIETIRALGAGSKSLAGSVMGTPDYMPPEQAHGDVDGLDQRSDVFGLGAILCEILTGKPPYPGPTPEEALEQARRGALEDAMSRLERCGGDPEIVALARRCLAIEPRGRPLDAGAVAREVSEHLSSAEERARAAEVEAARARIEALQERKRRYLATSLAATVLLSLLLGGAAWFRAKSQRRAIADEAVAMAARALQDAVDSRSQASGSSALDRWETALASAARSLERAQAALAADPSDRRARVHEERAVLLQEEVRRGIGEARRAGVVEAENRRVLARLEEIRELLPHRPDPEKLEEDLRRAFRSYRQDRGTFPDDGDRIDVESLEPKVAAERIRRSGLGDAMARSLDDWALALRRSGTIAAAERLLGIAIEADGDPLRREIRRAALGADPERRIAGLRKIADDLRRQIAAEDRPQELFPALTIDLLADSLLAAGETREAGSIYRAAHLLHPDDYWALHALALQADEAGENDAREFVRAAVASRKESVHAWKDLAASLVREEDLDGAAGALQQAARRAPADAAVAEELGNVLVRTEDLDGAVAAFGEAARLSPSKAEVQFRLATALERKGEPQGAVKASRKAIELDPAHVGARLLLAALLLENGSWEEALGSWTAVVALKPGLAAAHLGLGRSLAATGDVDGSIRALTTALELDPALPSARFHLGLTLARKGDLSGAVAALEKAVRADLKSFSPLQALAPSSFGPVPWIDHGQDESWEKTLEVLRIAPVGEQDRASRQGLLGEVLARLGRHEEALVALRIAADLDRKDLPTLLRLGLCLVETGKAGEAWKVSDRALELDPQGVAVRLLRGMVRLTQRDAADATSEFWTAVRNDASSFAAHYDTAQGLEKSGDSLRAVEQLRQAAALDAGGVRARSDLVLALERQEKFWEALGEVRMALGIAPRDPNLLRTAGRLFLRIGRAGDAAGVLRRSLARDPENSEALKLLGRALASRDPLSLGDRGGAVEAFKKVLLIADDVAAVEEALDGLDRLGKLGETASAILPQLFSRAPKEEPARQSYLAGRLLQGAGNWEDARAWLEKAAREKPAELRPYPHLIECFRRLGREAESGDRLEAAFAAGLAPDSNLLALWLSIGEKRGRSWAAVLVAWPPRAPAHQKVLFETAVKTAQMWRFVTAEPPGGWTQPDFDDAAFGESAAPFGRREGSDATIRTPWTTQDIWIRRSFEALPARLHNPRLSSSLVLKLRSFYRAVIYLNGKEIATVERGGGAAAGRPQNPWPGSFYFNQPIPDASALRDGRNVLAIHCHNEKGDQVIDAGLSEVIENAK